MNQYQQEGDIEGIQLRFIEAWESGGAPTLQEYVRLYPHVARELTEFVVTFIQTEAATINEPPIQTPSLVAERAVLRAINGTSARGEK